MSNCKRCQKEFDPVTGNQLYCSRTCYKTAKRNRHRKRHPRKINKVCDWCGTAFIASQKKVHTCCKECTIALIASKNRKFLDIPSCLESADRKIDKNIGYVRVYVPMHPEANTWGYVYEHRVVAEQMIGRRLLKNEIVHHKNGKRWDNRPENLEVMDRHEHDKLGGQRKEDLDI